MYTFKNQTTTPLNFVKHLIGHYSRREALAQGKLIDVTEQAKRFNYPCPVAISAGLFDQCVKWDRFDTDCQAYQDQDIRLSSVLTVARAIAKTQGFAKAEASFILNVLPRDGYSCQKTSKRLKIVLDKDDQNQPALTIMLVDDLHQALLDFTSVKQENGHEFGQ